jgi:ketosteroid isomerase-like protein
MVVAVLDERGRGRGSGVPFENRLAVNYTFSAGKIVRWEFFKTREAALEAAGLRE